MNAGAGDGAKGAVGAGERVVVDTCMGPGALIEVREEDGVSVVELPWKLANGSKAMCYVSSRGSSANAISNIPAAGASAEQDAEALPNPFAVLWPAYLCSFIDFLGIGIAIPILPYYVLEMPWEEGHKCPVCPQPADYNSTSFECGKVEGCGTATEVGLSIAFFGLGQVIGNLIMSKASDKLGRKLVVMMSLLTSSLGFLWCGLATTLTSLLLARSCTGIFGGTLPVVQAMVLDTIGDQRERPKYFGIASATLGMGFMAGPAVGAAVGAISGSKRTAFFSPVIIASACLVVAMFKVKETKPGGGFFGPRDPMAEKIFRAGEKQFKEYMREVKRERKRSLSIISTSSASSSGSAAKGDLLDDQTTPKLPPVVFACAVAIVCAALSFTAMTSMTGLVWLNLFNYGPIELGTFLTCIGLVSTIMNICGVKTAIRKFGPYKTALTACTLQSIGIAGFTFIDIFPVHVVYFVAFIAIGWSLTLPTMLFIAGEFTPPEIRGMATGIIAGSMSLGFAICPLMSGPAFESDILKLEHKHGSFSHVFFLIAGLGFGAVELFVICMYIGPKARSLHLNRPKERESGSKASRPGEDSAGENISPKDVEMQ